MKVTVQRAWMAAALRQRRGDDCGDDFDMQEAGQGRISAVVRRFVWSCQEFQQCTKPSVSPRPCATAADLRDGGAVPGGAELPAGALPQG